MPSLSGFQSRFALAMMSDEQPSPSLRFQAFAVYRNTAVRGAVEALRETYATVNQLLGDDGFTQVALSYWQEAPPAGPVLTDYGAGFAKFLAGQPWTCELPYLADVARLDWLWLESFLAEDADPSPWQVACDARISLHPATRVAWLSTPALTIWQAHRQQGGFDELEPEWREEGALITRPGLQVRAQPIDRASRYLLAVSASYPRVDQCVAAVAEAYPQSNVPALLQQCVTAGALILR
jgi:hypothetical protein